MLSPEAPMQNELDYHEIRYRLENYAVFRILRKESAAFMLGFFQDQFKRRHRADIGQTELAAALGAYQEFVRMSEGEEAQPREPAAYLDEWANEGFLRKYYPLEANEAHYEPTPDSERALEWIGELAGRPFVGTESRLIALFESLRELAYGASFDPAEQRAELERRRAAIDEEIARLDRGEMAGLEGTAILERYYGVEDSARRLLSDFKQIEQNFRELDRETKEKVIAADRSRGSVLKEVFEHRDAIVESDQGKSFSSFWAFLMSLEKREELSELVVRVLDIPAVRDAGKSFPLESLDSRLVGAGARVQDMTHRLNEELRRFLDERSRSEGIRVGELVEAFKRLALERRDDPPPARDFLSIEGEPELSLVMDRPLFTPEAEVVIAAGPEAEGRPSAGTDALYDIDSVDLAELSGRLSALLLESPQASLSEATSRFPVTQGAAEIIGYLSLAEEAGQSAVWGESRAGIEARNERRGSRLLVDSPDPSYLPEGKP
jgi:hypothetical protein